MKKILWVALTLISSNAFSSGLSKPVLVGPKAIGMGGAFVGIANDTTSIFHNPGAMTLIKGHQFGIGTDTLITDEHYTPPAVLALPEESADTEFLPVPQFGYVAGHKKFAWGLGVFFPHGNGGKFSSPSGMVTNPNEGRIYSMEVDPAFAYEIIPGLSVGASLRMVRVSSELKGAIVPFGVGFDVIDNLKTSGFGLGAAVGVYYRPCNLVSFGTNYRSKVSADLNGNVSLATNGNHTISYDQHLPTLVTAGFGLYPIDGLTIGLSYDFENNSEINTINALLDGVVPVALPQNFTDSHTVHVGAEYFLVPTIGFRAGYAKDFNTSVPDSTMDRIVGDIAAHEVSAGLSYKLNRYTLAGTWNARFGSRDITSATAKAPGHYEAFVQMISVGLEAAY